PHPGAAQVREVTPAAECGAEVAGERPHVGARTDRDRDVEVEDRHGTGVTGAAVQDLEAGDGDRPGGQGDVLAGPGTRIRSPAVDLDRAHGARDLLDLTREASDGGGDLRRTEVARAGGGDDLTLRVIGVRRLSEP